MEQGKLLILGRKVNSYGQLRVISGLAAALIGVAILTGPVSAATYRWVDDQGETIFSQIPPQDGRPYTKIGAPPPPPDGAGARKKLQDQRQGFADRRESERQDKEKSAKAAERNAMIEENCAKARNKLEALQDNRTGYSRQDDGSRKRVSAEERRSKIQETNDYLDKHCR